MADTQGAQPMGPTGEGPNGAEPTSDEAAVSREDYERLLSQSRRWERQSKANAEKAKKFDELAAKSMSDAERAEAAAKRASEAEAELARYRLADDRREWARKVSERTSVPADVLAALDVDSEKAMEEAAGPLRGYFERPAAPVVPTAGVQPSQPGAGKTPNEWLRETIPAAIRRTV